MSNPKAQSTRLLKGATLFTMVPGEAPAVADLRIRGSRIDAIAPSLQPLPGEEIVDLKGKVLLPGFVQGHIHLCQTLFRNVAEGLSLLDWLKDRIWPLEGAHTPDSLYATARMGIDELLLGGTTAILDMGTVHHTDAIFEAAKDRGIRAVLGKAMMDEGEGIPDTLKETTDSSLQESFDLKSRWEGSSGGRLGYAFAPRFVPSCSEALLKEVAKAMAKGARVHTHASEMLDEIALVKAQTGMDNLAYFDHLGLMGEGLTMAHCVWVQEAEFPILKGAGCHITHCPSSNMKLASGIAPVPRLLKEGINVCLGADGAPCNNTLDAFMEMRLAGLIQKPIHGPAAMPAMTLLDMATRRGALALGLGDEVGTLEVGKKADLQVLDLNTLGSFPTGELAAAIVYGAGRAGVRDVYVDGAQLVKDGALTRGDQRETLSLVNKSGPGVFKRAGLGELWGGYGGGLQRLS